MNRLLIILLLLACSCRAKKINRTVEKKDSVVTTHTDSSYLHVRESIDSITTRHDYERNTVTYFNKAIQPIIRLDSSGNVFISLPPIDSVVTHEKGRQDTKQTSAAKELDSGRVIKDNNTVVATTTKVVNKDIKPDYSWMYVAASIVLAVVLLIVVIYKLKGKLKL